MTVLLLKLAGPVQAWGDRSRFVRRETAAEPTKSGVVGLLAAALGRRRTDPIEDLAGLTFGVRADQPGSLLRDFQTAKSLDGSRIMPLSTRYYLSDAAFLAAVEGPDSVLEGLVQALRNPTFPLFLGRRACPPAEPVVASNSLREGSVTSVLRNEPWRASEWFRRRNRAAATVRLTVVVDATAADDGEWDGPSTVADQPVSFDPRDRRYGSRSVMRGSVLVDNPDHVPTSAKFGGHDAMAELGA